MNALDLLTLLVVADDARDLEVPRAKRARVVAGAFDIPGAGFRRDAEQPIRRAASAETTTIGPRQSARSGCTAACRSARTIAIRRSMAA